MVMSVEKCTADFIASSRSFGSDGRAKRGIPWMAISELMGGGFKISKRVRIELKDFG